MVFVFMSGVMVFEGHIDSIRIFRECNSWPHTSVVPEHPGTSVLVPEGKESECQGCVLDLGIEGILSSEGLRAVSCNPTEILQV